MATRPDLDTLYDALMDEEDARSCADIPGSACTNVPANFFRQVAATTLTGLGDALTNPKTTLAWLMGMVGAPVGLIAWLVPVRESGSLLPQLFIAAQIRHLPLRKGVWIFGSLAQAAALIAMGLIAWLAEGALAGGLILACLVAFSLARGLCSVAGKDVIGKTVPKRRRGRLNGLAGSLSGGLVLAFGIACMVWPPGDDDTIFYTALLAVSALLWLVAALVFRGIDEVPGATQGGRNGIAAALRRLKLLRDDLPFRRFVIARALLLCTALSAPFYVLLAQALHSGAGMLGAFLVANGLAGSLSSMVWGRLADRSSRRAMIGAALLGSLLGPLVLAIDQFKVLPEYVQPWLFPVAFFVLGVAHAGVRIGRKTYVLDLGGGERRTDYVAISNSVIGLVLLATGLFGLLGSMIGAAGMLLLLSLIGLAGAIFAVRLPEL
ncbi:MFS-type transporter involved in bile tolerance, Atg22 family [Halopseudomonas xinjiangensis]|uniref:MFS-type transporter involved in bile tolerance, Atg22 family n=1 Tax=Halopseudomonas xinjiangensis TaxID=487184 RepID=A0A1H1NE74_9GAMM|nr:MFS transporter [Halopseudomonas xinjiangensis]SDR97258.1 MFS-type transporter involved in bile tolerance, Atg22 family [Halopseudomonas xinjiangensis]